MYFKQQKLFRKKELKTKLFNYNSDEFYAFIVFYAFPFSKNTRQEQKNYRELQEKNPFKFFIYEYLYVFVKQPVNILDR